MDLSIIVFIISFFTLAGYNFSFWVIVGLTRYVHERLFPPKEQNQHVLRPKFFLNDVAAVIPAHNEELTIERTIGALMKILPQKNIYVASDYSTDKTIPIVRRMGIRSLDINPNLGKAKSLVNIMKEYGLLKAYKLILINDADTEIDKNYLKRALPVFNDPNIAAVATHGIARLQNYSLFQKLFITYRIRLWRIIQLGMRFGQTWKFTNVSFIVPGSLSLYRSKVLKKIEIDAQDLVIEDFNMTFELHRKKLGRIYYSPKIFGIHQDPYNLKDYIKQVQRWNIGFFQTVKRHGIWPSFFWFSTTAYYVELFLYALFISLVPIVLIKFAMNGFTDINIPLIYDHLKASDVLIGVFVMDYISTIIASILEKKPILLIYGLFFFILRYIDALIYLGSPIIAFTLKSRGTWTSPKRL
ncbi:MAG: hypothetical protein A3D74_00570 [Candidatus Levybacteria bacterium RIFCSPHIGHO2_02_FULL_37_13]|nr:MAG: hypothetical protein A3D74_00570 [Candidatus Levybacteria bacterium RIFCSPHIGHO2_02_FULL_37_13]OGH29994.1 MAG: hypothetical protein A3E40_00940 [Candidatus Levybacteria bacterium RIFCSPHIGHO2_12_FULL_37_9]OGH37859.1 MAG: hypothetical protein A3B41_01805 [Candidatus Levybacteria bacterium RIFCSPLOWO2_01_FULL_37_26]